MESILRFFRGCISGLFCLTRRLGVRHRVCFFSRQSDRLTEDFALLQESLAAADPTMELRTVCCRPRDRRGGRLPLFAVGVEGRLSAVQTGCG